MVRFNPKFKQDISKFYDYIIIVEGKKDISALKALGFEKVYAIHETGKPLRENLSEIVAKLDKKDKICILTDFDKKGKKLYLLLKEEISQMPGVKLDSSLRGLFIKSGISHVEGIYKFFEKIEGIY